MMETFQQPCPTSSSTEFLLYSSHQHYMVCQIHCMTIHTYIQPGSLTQKYEAFRPLYFTWQDSSAGAMVQITWVLVGNHFT